MGAVGGAWSYAGNNVAFGVREHAMGAAVNGMAAHGGVLPFSATFLVFSDYMKPSVRLGALSKLKAFYVFTHDSMAVGEDGPTHEPVEQLAGLRAIPGLNVMRPADANETAEALGVCDAAQWADPVRAHAAERGTPGPQQGARHCGTKGAYILSEAEGGAPEVILIGTGSEVALCVKAQEKLKGYGVKARVVSMPSWNLVCGAGRRVSRKRSAARSEEARHRGGGESHGLAPLGGRRGHGDRHRSLRGIGTGRRDHEELRIYCGACHLRSTEVTGPRSRREEGVGRGRDLVRRHRAERRALVRIRRAAHAGRYTRIRSVCICASAAKYLAPLSALPQAPREVNDDQHIQHQQC